MQKLADHYIVGQLTETNSSPSANTHTVTMLDKKMFNKQTASFNWKSFIQDNNNCTAYEDFVCILGQTKEACKKIVVINKRSVNGFPWCLGADKRKKYAPGKAPADNATLRDECRMARNQTTAQIRLSEAILCQTIQSV